MAENGNYQLRQSADLYEELSRQRLKRQDKSAHAAKILYVATLARVRTKRTPHPFGAAALYHETEAETTLSRAIYIYDL